MTPVTRESDQGVGVGEEVGASVGGGMGVAVAAGGKGDAVATYGVKPSSAGAPQARDSRQGRKYHRRMLPPAGDAASPRHPARRDARIYEAGEGDCQGSPRGTAAGGRLTGRGPPD